jgi:hypothetical protein
LTFHPSASLGDARLALIEQLKRMVDGVADLALVVVEMPSRASGAAR